MVEHTPGPWEVIETDERIETTACGPVKTTYRRLLNISDEERDANKKLMDAEARANAHLIAAAPDMLELLRDVKMYVRPYSWYQRIRNLIDKIEEA